MGKSRLSKPQISDLVKKMSREYAGRAYHIIKRYRMVFAHHCLMIEIAIIFLMISAWRFVAFPFQDGLIDWRSLELSFLVP